MYMYLANLTCLRLQMNLRRDIGQSTAAVLLLAHGGKRPGSLTQAWLAESLQSDG